MADERYENDTEGEEEADEEYNGDMNDEVENLKEPAEEENEEVEEAVEEVIEIEEEEIREVVEAVEIEEKEEEGKHSSKEMEVLYFGDSEAEEAESKTALENDEDPEVAKLSNLTPNQIKALIAENEKEINAVKDNIALIRVSIEQEEREECEVFQKCDKEERIREKRLQMQEEEIYLQTLKDRTALLKSVKTKYQPFPISKLPQVILCSPWTDKLMPKVVVCSKSKKTTEEVSTLDEQFTKLFSSEQLEMIEREKRWMEMQCGQLQVQIAGVKGKMRVIGKENNTLRAVVHEIPKTDDPIEVAFPGGRCAPCQRNNSGKTRPCPAYSTGDSKGPMVVNIDAKTLSLDADTPFSGTCKEELEDIEKKVEELQSALERARKRSGTVKAQADLLKCVKESLLN